MTSIMALLGVIGLLVLTVSGDSIGDDRELFTLALTLQSSTNVDIGQDAFNRIFWNSPQHILKRECSSCGSTHRVIYYKRYTELNSFNLYQSTYDWQSTHNVLGVDFNLFSTLQDALADTNPWTYCNYDDPNIGMFRDCGPTGGHGGEWTSRTRGGDAAAFYIYTGLGGGFFVIGDEAVSYWDEAERWCLDRGYHFASIHSAAESEVAAAMASGLDKDLWIGGRRSSFDPSSADYSKWEWADGTEWSYTNWHVGEPNNEGGNTPENYLMMYRNVEGTWNNRQPPVQHYPLCRTTNFVVGDIVGSWDEADKWCTDRGFKLASIHDAEDNVVAAAMGLALSNDMWLSGRRSADGDFEWSDGTAWDYEWWYPGEPNNQNEECLMLYQSAMWNDRNCDKDGHRALCTATFTPPVTSHWIAAGNPLNSKWKGIPTTECVADSSVQATQGTSKGTDIAVSCCSDSGSATRSGCHRAKTYEQANAICNQMGNGYRLCTLEEMLGRKTKGKGCSHDARYNWVSTPCGDGSDSINAAASSNVDGPNEVTGSGEGAASFEFDDFLPIVLGAAGGIAVIAAIVTVVVAMRKRKTAATETVVEAVHVPDDSVAPNTAKETETEMEVVTGTGPDVGADATE